MIPSNSTLNGTFLDNHLIVNDPDCSPQLLLPCTLYYTLPAPKTFQPKPKIKITVTIGESDNHMFSTRDSDYGDMICPEFNYRGHTQWNNQLTYVLVYSGDSECPQASENLTIEWEQIISTACEGICSVTVSTDNFGNGLDGTSSYYLYKSLARTEICYFNVFPASAYPGEEITLSWKVRNATKGYILPGGYDIFENGIQSASSKLVPMPSDNTSFFLYVLGVQQSVYRETKIFTPPPSINLTLEGQTAKWECHFAKNYEIAENNVYRAVSASGSLTVQKSTTSLAIRCKGENISEEEIRLVTGDSNLQFIKYIHQYQNHKVVAIYWKTPENTTATIELWDTRYYVLSENTEGSEGYFEYPYSLKINVIVGMIYTQKNHTPVIYQL